MNIKRYIALRPDNYEDGIGPMRRVREFKTKKNAVAWVKQQTGILGGTYGEGWAINEETVDDEGYLHRRTVWPFKSG